jgi:hypothetical protein
MEHFLYNLTKPDNIPIIMMVFLLIYFLGWAFKQGIENDRRIAQGKGPRELEESRMKVDVMPHLLKREFITALVVTVILVIWSIAINAPLEEMADPSATPNPSKAPWYFLGLQEMLVYFDPWIAGVIFPTLIIIGLIAIPYLDKNPKGNGYYTLKERPFAISFFLFGFVILWCVMIFVGTFMRGPGWNFFGLFEEWNIHKVVPLTNVNLSELLGIDPNTPWLFRELPGIIMVSIWFGVVPFFVAIWRRVFFKQMGMIRYWVTIILVLTMLSLPVKMILRWSFNLKYFIVTPWFNI